jgi:hypothetical protein
MDRRHPGKIGMIPPVPSTRVARLIACAPKRTETPRVRVEDRGLPHRRTLGRGGRGDLKDLFREDRHCRVVQAGRRSWSGQQGLQSTSTQSAPVRDPMNHALPVPGDFQISPEFGGFRAAVYHLFMRTDCSHCPSHHDCFPTVPSRRYAGCRG